MGVSRQIGSYQPSSRNGHPTVSNKRKRDIPYTAPTTPTTTRDGPGPRMCVVCPETTTVPHGRGRGSLPPRGPRHNLPITVAITPTRRPGDGKEKWTYIPLSLRPRIVLHSHKRKVGSPLSSSRPYSNRWRDGWPWSGVGHSTQCLRPLDTFRGGGRSRHSTHQPGGAE